MKPAPIKFLGMTALAIERVKTLEQAIEREAQIDIPITHTLHGGLYARTAHIPAGAVIVGALIKVPTLLILNGDCDVYTGEEVAHLNGYYVLSADAGRKSAFFAHQHTTLTMVFPTRAATVEEAEAAFTDETDKLQTRNRS